jgi:hypothetical protein
MEGRWTGVVCGGDSNPSARGTRGSSPAPVRSLVEERLEPVLAGRRKDGYTPACPLVPAGIRHRLGARFVTGSSSCAMRSRHRRAALSASRAPPWSRFRNSCHTVWPARRRLARETTPAQTARTIAAGCGCEAWSRRGAAGGRSWPGAVRFHHPNPHRAGHHALHLVEELPLARLLRRQVQAKRGSLQGHRAPLRCFLHSCKIRAGLAGVR